MSNFLELATQGRRLAASRGLRPVAFCDLVEAGDLPMLLPERRGHWEVASSAGAAPSKSGPSRKSGGNGRLLHPSAAEGL